MHDLEHPLHRLPVIQTLHQPNWTIASRPGFHKCASFPHIGQFAVEPSIRLPSLSNITEREAMQNCACSPVPHHMFLHGFFATTLGEFMVRVFYPMLVLSSRMEDVFVPDEQAKASSSSSTALSSVSASISSASTPSLVGERLQTSLEHLRWQAQSYLVVNFAQNKSIHVRGLLDSHRTMAESISANPVAPLQSLFDNAKCKCVQRMVFCGFSAQEEGVEGLQSVWREGTDLVLESTPNTELGYMATRDFLLQQLIKNDPLIEDAIREQRLELLEESEIELEASQDADESKIIGLTQRSSRRDLINIKDSIALCNTLRALWSRRVGRCQSQAGHPTLRGREGAGAAWANVTGGLSSD